MDTLTPSPATYTPATVQRAGIGAGLWAVHIPSVTTRLHLDPGVLGLLLLLIGIGAIISMPLASAIAAKRGSRTICIIAAFLYVVTLPLPIIAPTIPLAFIGAALFGLSMGGLDVAANSHGTEVESAYGKPTMSAFHGFFSLGGLAGSALGAAIIGLGYGNGSGAVAVSAVLFVVAVWASFNLLPIDKASAGVKLRWPNRAVIGIGILCGLAFALEGVVADWSSLFLLRIKDAGPVGASAGVILFMATMTVFRFLGDGMRLRFGGRNSVLAGGLCIALGTAIAISAPWVWLSAVGFALVGVGAANVVPILFSAAARVPAVPAAIGIASVTTLGYAGHLLAPPLIGFLARSFGLPLALSLVGVAGLIIAAGALRLRR
jgi:hypothetical protein